MPEERELEKQLKSCRKDWKVHSRKTRSFERSEGFEASCLVSFSKRAAADTR